MAARSDELMVRRETGGVFDSVTKLANAIRELEQRHIVVSPGGAMGGSLPVLHSAGVSFVFIDPERDTYRLPGRSDVGLAKSALDRIAAAAGVRWDPHLCGRTDDGHDPHLVEYQAFGTVRQLDGTERPIHAQKRIDLRAERATPEDTWGSDAQEIARVARMAGAKNGGAARDPWPQILQQRSHIMSLAESKAKNRAIRSLGVRTGYTTADLAKGFAVVRLQFTGRHEDPEVERAVAMMVAEKALGSSAALYGTQRQTRGLQPSGPVPRLAAAPDDEDPSSPPFQATSAAPPSSPAAPAQPPDFDAPPDDDHDPWGSDDPGPVAPPPHAEPRRPSFDPQVPLGKGKGRGPASSLSASALDRLATWMAEQRDSGRWDEKWAEKNQEQLDAIVEWAAYKTAVEQRGGR